MMKEFKPHQFKSQVKGVSCLSSEPRYQRRRESQKAEDHLELFHTKRRENRFGDKGEGVRSWFEFVQFVNLYKELEKELSEELSSQQEYLKLKERYDALQRTQRNLLGEDLGA